MLHIKRTKELTLTSGLWLPSLLQTRLEYKYEGEAVDLCARDEYIHSTGHIHHLRLGTVQWLVMIESVFSLPLSHSPMLESVR